MRYCPDIFYKNKLCQVMCPWPGLLRLSYLKCKCEKLRRCHVNKLICCVSSSSKTKSAKVRVVHEDS